ncbi:MAG: hypothetical protein BMS9Abin05_2655 [Rhodothermia bacterium]|nr:MAG: hypothetical protein BMS9Abin05_2655 [Rhodothermia bacterium]
MADKKRLHALVQSEIFEWLEAYSEENNRSMSETVRGALAEYYYRESKRDFFDDKNLGEVGFLIDKPTIEEDSVAGLAERLLKLEYAVHMIYHRPGSPGGVSPSDVVELIPNYLKL